jgi:hypothetical protein
LLRGGQPPRLRTRTGRLDTTFDERELEDAVKER